MQGSIPECVIPKSHNKMAPDASMLSAQHIKIGLDSLSSQTCSKD